MDKRTPLMKKWDAEEAEVWKAFDKTPPVDRNGWPCKGCGDLTADIPGGRCWHCEFGTEKAE